MTKWHVEQSCSNLSSSGHCIPLCSVWMPVFSGLLWHYFLKHLHPLLVIVIAQPPFAQVLMSSNQTCKNLEAYLVPRGLSTVHVPGQEGTKDSNSPLGDSFFSCYYFSHGHSAFLWKTCETWRLQVSFFNDENADQVESMGLSKEKRIRKL